jgi:hypothetical protein
VQQFERGSEQNGELASPAQKTAAVRPFEFGKILQTLKQPPPALKIERSGSSSEAEHKKGRTVRTLALGRAVDSEGVVRDRGAKAGSLLARSLSPQALINYSQLSYES